MEGLNSTVLTWLWRTVVMVLVTGACGFLGLGVEWLMNIPNSLMVVVGVVVWLTLVTVWVLAFIWFIKPLVKKILVEEIKR